MKKKWITSPGTRVFAMAAAVVVLVAAIQNLSVAAPDGLSFADLDQPCN